MEKGRLDILSRKFYIKKKGEKWEKKKCAFHVIFPCFLSIRDIPDAKAFPTVHLIRNPIKRFECQLCLCSIRGFSASPARRKGQLLGKFFGERFRGEGRMNSLRAVCEGRAAAEYGLLGKSSSGRFLARTFFTELIPSG